VRELLERLCELDDDMFIIDMHDRVLWLENGPVPVDSKWEPTGHHMACCAWWMLTQMQERWRFLHDHELESRADEYDAMIPALWATGREITQGKIVAAYVAWREVMAASAATQEET
jgi:hypothetical protein